MSPYRRNRRWWKRLNGPASAPFFINFYSDPPLRTQ
jgi:hypothetical protein